MGESQLDLSVEIAGVRIKNPVILAAGPTSRNSAALIKAAECGAGAVVTKTIYYKGARVARPCIIKVSGGLLNAVEWSELNYELWVKKEIPEAKKSGIPVIASISSVKNDPEEISGLTKAVAEAGADMVEIATAYTVKQLPSFVKVAKEVTDIPVIAKMVLTTFDLKDIGKECEKAGADAISCMDTIGPCLKIDIETGKPILGKLNGTGRLSGPPIKPLTVYHVAELARAVDIPIIGVGGIMTGEDAVEMMMAGARAVEVCTATILKGPKILGDIANGIASFMGRKGYKRVDEFICLALKQMEERKKREVVIYEGMPPIINPDLCNGCGICAGTCPYDAIAVVEKIAKVDKSKCYGCGLCSSVCPQHAIKLPY